jgi:hypothetical protein
MARSPGRKVPPEMLAALAAELRASFAGFNAADGGASAAEALAVRGIHRDSQQLPAADAKRPGLTGLKYARKDRGKRCR